MFAISTSNDYCGEFVSVAQASQDAMQKAFPGFEKFPEVEKS